MRILSKPKRTAAATRRARRGSDKVPTFVALIGAQEHLNVAVLIDFQKKDQQSVENLYKRKLLNKRKVLTYADYVC